MLARPVKIKRDERKRFFTSSIQLSSFGHTTKPRQHEIMTAYCLLFYHITHIAITNIISLLSSLFNLQKRSLFDVNMQVNDISAQRAIDRVSQHKYYQHFRLRKNEDIRFCYLVFIISVP